MNTKKPTLGMKETTSEQRVSNGTVRPKNPSANILPTDGYLLEIDGKLKSEYESLKAAMEAGLELKKRYPFIRVIVYGAKERTRTVVALSERSEEKTEAAS